MDRQAYDAMAAIDENHWWYKARRSIIKSLIARWVRPQKRLAIVEIGCGTGANLAALTPFGTVTGVEPDEHARAHAASRSGCTILEGYLPNQLPLDDGVFDLMVMLDVLEHLDDDVAALKAMRPKLNQNGALLLAVPAAPWMWSHHDEVHHHKRRYTKKTLLAAFAAAGWRVERASHFNTLLFSLVALTRIWKNWRKDTSLDTDIPPQWLNGLLEQVFALEAIGLGRVPFGFGVSLVVLARPF